jgi:hypothetical protein
MMPSNEFWQRVHKENAIEAVQPCKVKKELEYTRSLNQMPLDLSQCTFSSFSFQLDSQNDDEELKEEFVERVKSCKSYKSCEIQRGEVTFKYITPLHSEEEARSKGSRLAEGT